MPTALNELLAQLGIRKSEFAAKADLSPATVDRLCNRETYVASEATYGRAVHILNELRGSEHKAFTLESVFPERYGPSQLPAPKKGKRQTVASRQRGKK